MNNAAVADPEDAISSSGSSSVAAMEPISRAESVYLQMMFEIAEDGSTVAQARLAERLEVSRPAVSQMMRRLARAGLVEVDRRQVRLTELGRTHAGAVVRRHRLVEVLLTDRLGLSLAEAHAQADRMEHAMSPAAEAALDEYLGYPTTCPHGNPIPGAAYDAPDAWPLASAAPGDLVYVERIPARLRATDHLLERLEHQRLTRGLEMRVIGVAPDGGVRVGTSSGEILVEPEIADHLLVGARPPVR